MESMAIFFFLKTSHIGMGIFIAGWKLELVQLFGKWQKALTALISDLGTSRGPSLFKKFKYPLSKISYL